MNDREQLDVSLPISLVSLFDRESVRDGGRGYVRGHADGYEILKKGMKTDHR